MAQVQRTLLQIVNAVQQELGLPVSATVIGNSDLTTVQMLSLAQLAIEELRDANDAGWATLETEFNLVVTPPTTLVCDTVQNSPVLINCVPAVSSTSLAANYWYVSGTSIPQGARILSVNTIANTITMTMEAVGTSTAQNIVFSQDTYALPTDINKYTNRTWWDRTNHWELLGPDSPQMDQWHRSGIVATGPRRHWRQIGPFANEYRLWPPPAEIVEPLQLVYEYSSRNAIATAGSQTSFSEFWTTDTDQPLLNDRAIIMSIKWRFWEQKGMNWTSKRDEYDQFVSRLMARDGGAQTLNLVQRINPIFISPANVQDGFFPGPIGPNTV